MATLAKSSYSPVSLFCDIWKLLKGKRFVFVVAVLMRIGAKILYLYPVYAFAQTITYLGTFHQGMSLNPVWFYIGSWLGAMVISTVMVNLGNYIVFQISTHIWLSSGVSAMNHILLLDIAWHERENTGNKLKRINRGAESFDNIVRLFYSQILPVAVNFIGVIVIVGMVDTFAAGSIVLYMVVHYIVASSLTKKTRAASREVNIAEEEIGGLEFEVVNNVRTVKVLGMIQDVMARLQKSANHLSQKIRVRVFWFQFRGSILNTISSLFRAGTLVYIVYGISQGNKTVGFLILFFGYFEQITDSIDRIADIAQDYLVRYQNIERMKEITSLPITIDDDKGKGAFPKNWQTLTLSDVSFKYQETGVLENISLTIKRGEKVGLVGLSGAGKSTLFKLLLKEYEDYSGDIRVNDVSLKTIRRSAYLQHIAVVMQETEVFNFSLKENIVMAQPAARRDKALLSRAMQTAHVADFVVKLPEGVDTLIGEKGVKLSGGEKQRVGIARAIFKKPEILFMDEATSHLDLESEEKIRDSLHRFFKGITAVVIAHRLTTIKEMDRIIVLEDGRIIEEGTFDLLMKQQGRFYTLWQKQQL